MNVCPSWVRACRAWFAIMCASSLLAWYPLHAAPRFYGSEEPLPDEAPWVAALFEAGGDPVRDFLGTGALIHPRFIITAAHAVTGMAPGEISCVIGSHDLAEEQTEVFEIVDVIVHPTFGEWEKHFAADLALLRLGSAVTDIEPILILEAWAPDTQIGAEARAIGWGGNDRVGRLQSLRQRVTLPLVSRTLANEKASYNGELIAGMLPVGTPEMETDACLEDSVAPLVVTTELGDQLAGLVSSGSGCRKPNKYRVCTDLYHYRPWILSFLWPNYAAWEMEHGAVGVLGDHDGDGVSNVTQYQARSGVDLEALVRGWAEGSASILTFPLDQTDVVPQFQVSDDLEDWIELADTDIDVTEDRESGTSRWTINPPETPGAQRYTRFRSQLAGNYVARPKPLWTGTEFASEVMGADERIGDQQTRDYLLTQLPEEGNAQLRIVSPEFASVVKLLNPATGETVSETTAEAGAAAILIIPGPEDLIARVTTTQANPQAMFDIALTGAPKLKVTPTELETRVHLGTTPDALTLRVRNDGEGLLDYSLTSDKAWIELDPATGSVEPGKTKAVKVRFNISDLVDTGVFPAKVTVNVLGTEPVDVPLDLCVVPQSKEIRAGDQIRSQLTNETPQPRREGNFMERWLFEAPEQGRYLFSMGSTKVDCYLYVVDPKTGELLAESDDNGLGFTYNAGILWDMEPGDVVIIEATTFGAWGQFGNVGPYSMNVVIGQ